MDSGTKRDVPVLGPIDNELVRVLELFWVMARCGEVHQDLVAPLDVDVVVVLDVFVGDAGHGDRCVEAQEFFDGDGQDLGFIEQALQIAWVGAQVPQRGTNGAPGGVDARNDQQVGDAHNYFGRSSSSMKSSSVSRILLGIGHAFVDLAADEPDEFIACLHARFGVVDAFAEQHVDPMHELVGHAGVNADQVGDHPGRNLLGVVDGAITLAALDEAVDELMTELLGVLLVGGHSPRSEGRQQHAPRPGLDWRVCGNWCGRNHLLVAREFRSIGGRRHYQHLPRAELWNHLGHGSQVIEASRVP
ncbi:hypothetical protein GQR58_030641 [Nymphon striatum]|nr:hypothetical protein GQR58_030641 [Nymphon striatum]